MQSLVAIAALITLAVTAPSGPTAEMEPERPPSTSATTSGSSVVVSPENDDESRLEIIPSADDLLIRGRVQMEALNEGLEVKQEMRMAAIDGGGSGSLEETTTPSAVNGRVPSADSEDRVKLDGANSADIAGRVQPDVRGVSVGDSVKKLPHGGASSGGASAKAAVASGNKRTTMLNANVSTGHSSEMDPMKKAEVPVVYSLEGDMMTGDKGDTSVAKWTSAVQTAEQAVVEEVPTSDAKPKKSASRKNIAERTPYRYVSAVPADTEPGNATAKTTEDGGKKVEQPEESSSKPAVSKVQGASRQFGSIPQVVPFTEELLLQSNAVKTYEGYKVYRIGIESSRQQKFIHGLADDLVSNVSLWNEPRIDENVTFIVPAETAQQVEQALSKQDLRFDVLTDNLKSWIDAEREGLNPELFLQDRSMANFRLDKYHSFDEIMSYLDLLADQYPSRVRRMTLGSTYENNPIRGLVVSTGGNKRAVYVDGGTHAREWISVASVLYLLTIFTTKIDSDPEVMALLNHFDFHFVPVVNPDGYKYTWKGDRLWRKNRVRFQGFFWCTGVDPNRNFDFHWGTEGASADPCAQTYRGPSAFSESESRAVRDYIGGIKNDLSLYLSVHSYGQYLLAPYGTGPLLESPKNDDLMAAGSAFREGVYKSSGYTYRVGGSKKILYAASGLSSDWVHDQGVTYSYVVELRDQGYHGFLLPASEIVPTSEEILGGVKALLKHITVPETTGQA
ncbi:carboxypeptidase A2-like [Tropilaelaps mercedesae]|uniref:Carboxypeptidase A2-like n=1 Tax=Tropilaelaps mercedesae TaxID=418985 RepID=A0A1V9XAQ1_9ACAR|nr:carboxypeptidase A2-like [Tropilaelaps mercedesae]